MIASPHGDGYCPVCRFIVGLDPDLLLENHTREDSNYASGRALCKGSGRRPPKKIPYSSTKSRFKVKAAKVPCPVCGGFQTLKWGQVRWTKDDKGNAQGVHYECEQCQGKLSEPDKHRMIRNGR